MNEDRSIATGEDLSDAGGCDPLQTEDPCPADPQGDGGETEPCRPCVEDPAVLAEGYLDQEKGVFSVEDALAGASDIIAEMISDDADIRKALRQVMEKKAVLCAQAEDGDADLCVRYSESTESLGRDLTEALTRHEGRALVFLRQSFGKTHHKYS